MSQSEPTLSEEIAALFKKSTAASQTFFTEGIKMVQGMKAEDLKSPDLSKAKDGFMEALNLVARLNIQYANNMLDLGMAVTKRMAQATTTTTKASPTDGNGATTKDGTAAASSGPAFVLRAQASPGGTAVVQFLLDSDQSHPILCELKETAFSLQDSPDVKRAFGTQFSPQSFELKPGNAQKVDIQIQIPEDTKEGVYFSNIVVHGFENTFFSVYVTVTSPQPA